MELHDIPDMTGSRAYHLVDWRPALPVEAHPELLKKMNKGRSRQSETSRKRQAFITGMGLYRPSADEQARKREYLEEWNLRMLENE